MADEQKQLKNHLFCTGLRFDLSASQVAAIFWSIVPELLAPALFNKKLFKKQSDIPLGLLQVTLKVQQRGSGSEMAFHYS